MSIIEALVVLVCIGLTGLVILAAIVLLPDFLAARRQRRKLRNKVWNDSPIEPDYDQSVKWESKTP